MLCLPFCSFTGIKFNKYQILPPSVGSPLVFVLINSDIFLYELFVIILHMFLKFHFITSVLLQSATSGNRLKNRSQLETDWAIQSLFPDYQTLPCFFKHSFG